MADRNSELVVDIGPGRKTGRRNTSKPIRRPPGPSAGRTPQSPEFLELGRGARVRLEDVVYVHPMCTIKQHTMMTVDVPSILSEKIRGVIILANGKVVPFFVTPETISRRIDRQSLFAKRT